MTPQYQVVYAESVRQTLNDLVPRVVQQGLAPTVLSALRTLDERLHEEPRLYGEPKYRFRALRLELRVAIEPPLVVHFTVHDEQPLVFVKSIQLLPR